MITHMNDDPQFWDKTSYKYILISTLSRINLLLLQQKFEGNLILAFETFYAQSPEQKY